MDVLSHDFFEDCGDLTRKEMPMSNSPRLFNTFSPGIRNIFYLLIQDIRIVMLLVVISKKSTESWTGMQRSDILAKCTILVRFLYWFYVYWFYQNMRMFRHALLTCLLPDNAARDANKE